MGEMAQCILRLFRALSRHLPCRRRLGTLCSHNIIADSKLFVVPNVCPGGPTQCGTFYFLWEENKFRLIRKVPVSAVPIIPKKSPLLGTWKGEWSYTNGVADRTQSFTLQFVEKTGRLTGTYTTTAGGRARSNSIMRFVVTKVDKSAYQMDVLSDCWTVQVEGDQMSGSWNGGACGPTGMGAAARLIGLRAERVR